VFFCSVNERHGSVNSCGSRLFRSKVLVSSSTLFVIPGLGAQYLLSGAERVTSGLQVEVLTPVSARIGVGKAFASPPSEPCVRFSRTRLSSRWFPHRECLALSRPPYRVRSPGFARKAWPSLTPLPGADTIRSGGNEASTYDHRWLSVSVICLALAGTHMTVLAPFRSSRIQLPASLPSGRFC
jgi:hypothetical protein